MKIRRGETELEEEYYFLVYLVVVVVMVVVVERPRARVGLAIQG